MTNYDYFAETFSRSRKNMKWEEIDYFISSYLSDTKWKSILDIWCGSGRLLQQFSNDFDIDTINYLWLDLSDEILNEARTTYSNKEFLNIDMSSIEAIKNRKFDYIFFIASFHHLENIEGRLEVLEKSFNLLNKDWKIFLTNWSLNSWLNKDKYEKSIVTHSENEFWSLDYNIKIWKYQRFYHWFSLKELEYLFQERWFEIIENREFENQKNFVSIIKKASL